MAIVAIILGVIAALVLLHHFLVWLGWNFGVRNLVYDLDRAIESTVKLSSPDAILQFEDLHNSARFVRFCKKNPSGHRGEFEMELPRSRDIEVLAREMATEHPHVYELDSTQSVMRFHCDRDLQFATKLACAIFSTVWGLRPEDEYRMRHRGGMAWPRLTTGAVYWNDRV